MPKDKIQAEPVDEKSIFEKTKSLFDVKPPMCTNSGNVSDIDVYIKNSRMWVTVATTYTVDGVDAEDMADFIINAIKHYSNHLSDKK